MDKDIVATHVFHVNSPHHYFPPYHRKRICTENVQQQIKSLCICQSKSWLHGCVFVCKRDQSTHTHTDAQTNKLTYRHTPFFHKLKKLLKGLKVLFNPISNSILIDTSHLNTPPFSSRHISKSNLTTLKKVSIICMICPHIRICRPSLF